MSEFIFFIIGIMLGGLTGVVIIMKAEKRPSSNPTAWRIW